MPLAPRLLNRNAIDKSCCRHCPQPPLPAPIIPIPVAGAAPRAKQLAPGSGTPRKPGRPRKNQPLERASSDGDPLAPFWPSPVARPGGGAAVAAPAGAAAAAAAAAGDDAATQPAKRARKEKAAKDPRKPKKPLSSYIVFLQRQMSTVGCGSVVLACMHEVNVSLGLIPDAPYWKPLADNTAFLQRRTSNV